ncbi:hypothetical protein J6590_025753, partial [Homalodisca vitripennis]
FVTEWVEHAATAEQYHRTQDRLHPAVIPTFATSIPLDCAATLTPIRRRPHLQKRNTMVLTQLPSAHWHLQYQAAVHLAKISYAMLASSVIGTSVPSPCASTPVFSLLYLSLKPPGSSPEVKMLPHESTTHDFRRTLDSRTRQPRLPTNLSVFLITLLRTIGVWFNTGMKYLQQTLLRVRTIEVLEKEVKCLKNEKHNCCCRSDEVEEEWTMIGCRKTPLQLRNRFEKLIVDEDRVSDRTYKADIFRVQQSRIKKRRRKTITKMETESIDSVLHDSRDVPPIGGKAGIGWACNGESVVGVEAEFNKKSGPESHDGVICTCYLCVSQVNLYRWLMVLMLTLSRYPCCSWTEFPDWPTHAKKLEELARDGLTTTFRGAHYRLKVTTVEDLRAVQRYLCSKKLSFYTHNLGRERSLKVVISGLPDTDGVEFFDVLTDEGSAVNEDARLRTARGPTGSWVITLTRDSERTLTPRRLAKSTTWQACSMSGSKSLCVKPVGGKSSEDELPQNLDGEGSLLQLWRRSQRQLSWVSSLQGGQSGSCPLGRKSRPTKPAARRPMRDESPADSVSESEAEDDMPQKKKRRRKPRNPANRLTRPPASVADLPVTQRPRATPRQKLEWPPTPATPPQQTEVPAADAASRSSRPRPA